MRYMEKLSIEKIIKKEMASRTVRFWGVNYENFAPVLAQTQHGDGKRLMWFSSMDTRPNYYLVRVDSKLPMDDSDESVDTVYDFVTLTLIEALEDEFGYFCNDHRDGGEEYPGFPVVLLDTGYNWGFFDEYGNEFII